jgi:hypothetical protein
MPFNHSTLSSLSGTLRWCRACGGVEVGLHHGLRSQRPRKRSVRQSRIPQDDARILFGLQVRSGRCGSEPGNSVGSRVRFESRGTLLWPSQSTASTKGTTRTGEGFRKANGGEKSNIIHPLSRARRKSRHGCAGGRASYEWPQPWIFNVRRGSSIPLRPRPQPVSDDAITRLSPPLPLPTFRLISCYPTRSL